MFATAEPLEADRGFRGFIKEIFSEPEVIIKKVNVPQGDCFYRVGVKEYRGQIPLEKARESLSRLRQGVIFSLDFPYDEALEELSFRPKNFGPLLLFNSAVDYIKKLNLNPLTSSITVFDSGGLYADCIERLVPLFSEIEIFSRCEALYHSAGKKLFEKYGVSIPVFGRFRGRPPESSVILSYESVPFGGYYKGIIFTNGDFCPPCGCALTGKGFTLPGEYEVLRPGGVDKFTFAAALYEKCGVRSLGELTFDKVDNYV